MSSTLLSYLGNLASQILSIIQESPANEGVIATESIVARAADSLSEMVCRIRAVLSDAEEREITDEFVKLWLHDLKDVAYDAEDILSDFNHNLLSLELEHKFQIYNRKRKSKVIHSIRSQSYEATLLSRMQRVTERFIEICQARDALSLREEDGPRRFKSSIRPPSSSFFNPLEIFGRESDKKKIIDALIRSNVNNLNKVEVVALVAMGGMGKTTLAKLVFNNEDVQKHFLLRGWVWVSEFCDEITITKSIIESFTNQECSLCQLDALQKQLKEILNEKIFLLVLDDIWIEDRVLWEVIQYPLFCGAKGSRILITTENHTVLKCMRANFPIPLNGLLKADSWLLFSHHAFNGKQPNVIPSKILEIGERIVDNCNGVPLVVKMLGGLLASTTNEQLWEYVLESNVWELDVYRKNMHILNLSYRGLPRYLKPCFRSCAMFPKGHEFEIDSLVRIWSAQRLIQAEEIKHLEVGRMYVDELLQRSFFQNKVTRGTKCKFTIHSVMHDLAKWIEGGESAVVENEELWNHGCKNIRHLTVVVKKEEPVSFGPSHEGLSSLRSLLIHSYNQSGFHFDGHSFNHGFLQYLQVLDLNFWKSRELPETIGNLKHLRFLGLSGQRLSESICSLLNLKTLDLRTRGNHITFPTRIRNLKSLRHLIVSPWDVSRMPAGIGDLTNLESLSVFAVSRERGSATLSELQNLKNLRGELHITGLHHMFHSKLTDSQTPNLHNKKNLTHLTLHWSTFLKSKTINNDEKLLKILQPHTNIQHVVVEGYRGTMFPSWLEFRGFTSLTQLKLDNCENCTKLPAVGQLPVLQHLKLERLKGLKILGLEFYGNSIVSFPSLETLSFYDMPELEIWRYRDGDGSPFPCLRDVHISLCQKLRSLQISNLLTLQRCSINWCDNLATVDGLDENWIVTGQWNGMLDLPMRGWRGAFSGSPNCRNISSSILKLEKVLEPNMASPTLMIIGCPLLKKNLSILNKQHAKNSGAHSGRSSSAHKTPRYGLVQLEMIRKAVINTPITSEQREIILPLKGETGQSSQQSALDMEIRGKWEEMDEDSNDQLMVDYQNMFPLDEETDSLQESPPLWYPTCPPQTYVQTLPNPQPQPYVQTTPTSQPYIQISPNPQPYVQTSPNPQPHIQTSPNPQPYIQTSPNNIRNNILLGFTYLKSAPSSATETFTNQTAIYPPLESTQRTSY